METREIITMILEILIGLSILIGGIAFILRWCFKINKRLVVVEQKLIGLDEKIDDLPNKIKSDLIDPFMSVASNNISNRNNTLSEEEIKERN